MAFRNLPAGNSYPARYCPITDHSTRIYCSPLARTIKRFIRAISLGAVLLISACQTVRYEYTAPETDAGKQCVVQCASVRELCRHNANQRAQTDKILCEKRLETNYLVCMKKAKDDTDRQKECDKKRGQCFDHLNYQTCDEEYNQCFSNCGGIVNKIIENK